MVDSVKSKMLLDTIVKNRGLPPRTNCPNNWQNVSQRTPPRPFQGQSHLLFNPNRSTTFNSSNAPQSFNNVAVPMDLSRTQGNRGQRKEAVQKQRDAEQSLHRKLFQLQPARTLRTKLPPKETHQSNLRRGTTMGSTNPSFPRRNPD